MSNDKLREAEFCTCHETRPMECDGCRKNRERREALAASKPEPQAQAGEDSNKNA